MHCSFSGTEVIRLVQICKQISQESALWSLLPCLVHKIEFLSYEIYPLCRVEERLSSEEAKFKQWHQDNQRRRNNYIPYIFNLLRILAEEGKLQGLIEKAQIPKVKQEQ